MTRAPVVLDELDQVGVVLSCTTDEARALMQTRLVEVRPEGEGRWRILPRGYVGAALAGDLQVQVDPKGRVGVRHVLFLLGYAADPGFRPEDVSAAPDDELWPALAESLARSVERALSGGVLQGYRTVDASLRTVRGRIRLGDQFCRPPGMLLPLEVTYDEFTVDTVENRIMRTALRRMAGLARVNREVRQRLRHLDARLEGVSPLPAGSQLPRWLPTRMNERYRPALRLAEVVLRNSSTHTGHGGLEVASFVVSMWSVFEEFVTVALTEALARHPGRTERQLSTHLDEPAPGRFWGEVRMNVDVVHCDPWGRPLVVYDAKYKAAGRGGQYANADHYQMLAYCTALRVPVAWLVYAQGADEPVARSIRHTDVTVVEYPLDLAADPLDLLRQVARLADASVQPHTASVAAALPAR